jgi:hypothetical protein
VEKLSPDARQAFVKAAQPGLFEYDEATNVLRVTETASRKVINIDDLLLVGQQALKGEDNLVSVSIMPERFWFRVEVGHVVHGVPLVPCAWVW